MHWIMNSYRFECEAADFLQSVGPALPKLGGWLWGFLNTNFSAALFGALAGALAAHYVATRSEERKRLRGEIAGINAAIALANAISNVFIAVKRQHTRGMLELYKRDFDRYIAILVNPPTVPTVFEFINDFRELDVPFTPIVELRETLLDRVPSAGAALSVATVLQQTIDSFKNLIEARNRSIERLKLLNEEDRASAYYGIRNRQGHLDERYADQMSGLRSTVDNGIYFPMLLCDMLTDHGAKIRDQHGRGAPKISTITYGAFEVGLLPDPTEFPDFEKNFRPKPKGEAKT